MSGKWKRSMVAILRHSQTKGRATGEPNCHLNHRVTSRLYWSTFKITALEVENLTIPESGDFEYEFQVEVRPHFDLPAARLRAVRLPY